MTSGADSDPTLKSRLAHEFKVYAAISLYLFLCFSAIVIYGASRSEPANVPLSLLATAAVKALITGKFILIGEALKPGTRRAAKTLLLRIGWRSLGLLLVLVALKLLEELILGMAHGQNISAIIGELTDTSWIALLAPIMVMLLILIPLMTAIELDKALGAQGLKGLLLREA